MKAYASMMLLAELEQEQERHARAKQTGHNLWNSQGNEKEVLFRARRPDG